MQISSAAWAHLPKELQTIVFYEFRFNKKTLMELQLTCKAWRHVAEEFLYQQLSLDLDSTAGQTEHLITTLELPDSQYNRLVKIVALHKSFDSHHTITDYTVLLLRASLVCPNLTKIINYGAIPWTDFYRFIAPLRKAGFLQKVDDFEGCRVGMDNLESYNNAMIEFAGSLRRLTLIPQLEFRSNESNANATDAYALGRHLKQFVCLQRLWMILPDGWELCRMDQLIDRIPNSLTDLFIRFTETSTRFDRMIEEFEAPPDGHRLTTLTHLDLEGMSIFTDQDILLMMRKFSYIKSLELHFDLLPMESTLRLDTVQSASVVCKFMDYLTHQKNYSTIRNFTTTHQIMDSIMTQLSNLTAVRNMKFYACPTTDITYPVLSFKGKPDPQNGYKVCLDIDMPSSNMELLYQHAIEAFRQIIEKMELYGKPATEDVDFENFGVDDFQGDQYLQNIILKNSIDYILSNYPALKILKLQDMLLQPFTSTSTNEPHKRELEELEITECCVHPRILCQFSQRLTYIKNMQLFATSWIPDDLAMLGMEQGYTINMPFTVFDTIHLDTFRANGQSCLFTVWTSTKVVRFKLDGLVTRAVRFLSEEEFEQVKHIMPHPYYIMIYCQSCKSIGIDESIIVPIQ